MCGRYTLTSQAGLAEEFMLAVAEPAEASEWWRPRFNIAPTQPAPVVVARDGVRAVELMRWGLVPPWADGPAVGARMINARVESLSQRPAFRDAVKHRRCLVAADGFYEWVTRGDGKAGKRVPMYLRPVPRRPVGFAGLWERWRGPDGAWLVSFAIVTGPPNPLVEPIHDRMPVVVAPTHYATWLAPGPLPASVLAEVL
ncbi:MAG: SOS response-associated peptidase, partial [Myxococcales bacterium]|nr:SOS response-associated peptidase [Myxococcales bacterium]